MDVIDELIAMDVQFMKGLVDNKDMTAKEKLQVIPMTSIHEMHA